MGGIDSVVAIFAEPRQVGILYFLGKYRKILNNRIEP